MTAENTPKFYSKILLFGEYSVIHNSMALTVPFDDYNGKLAFEPLDGDDIEIVKSSNKHLYNFAAYIRNLIEEKKIFIDFAIDNFENDIHNGMYFHSTIPQGFGIGSSGALVAAIYDKYTRDKVNLDQIPNKEQIAELKRLFSLLESYFHGTSSGVDPLICYMNLPLLIKGKDNIEPVKVALHNHGKGAIFLIDTGIPRKSEPLVQYYMGKLEEHTFREFVDKQLKPFANNCIQAFLEGDNETLFAYMKKLSKFQLEHFKPMIPKLFNSYWEKGIETGDYYLKLCGAGGGGYLLGFTKNFEKTKRQLKGQKLELLCSL